MKIEITSPNFTKITDKNAIKLYSSVLSENKYMVAGSTVSAGFPAYAENFKTDPISIDKFLVNRPESTFIIEVSGESMIDAGIYPNSYIIVDTSVKAQNKSIVVARYADDFLVKRLYKFEDYAILKAETSEGNYPDIKLTAEDDFEIWGVVVGTFKKI